MKTIALLFGALCALVFAAGCASTPRTIEAASTTYNVSSKGHTASLSLPKELKATKLDLSVDPRTGVVNLKADQIESSSQRVIDSAGVATANANAELAKMLGSLTPALFQLLASVAGLPVAQPAATAPAAVPTFTPAAVPASPVPVAPTISVPVQEIAPAGAKPAPATADAE